MQSKFTGGLGGLIGTNIGYFIIVGLTLGIGTPWAICYKENWYAKHTTIDGKQLVFTGKGGALFVKFIKWFLLTIVTLGIYGFWLNIKVHQWVVENTHTA